jgi:hypothetical protein
MGLAGRNPPRLVAREWPGTRPLILGVGVSEGLSIMVAHDEIGVLVLDSPGRREAARTGHLGTAGPEQGGKQDQQSAWDDQKQCELKEQREVHHEAKNRASVCNHSPIMRARCSRSAGHDLGNT